MSMVTTPRPLLHKKTAEQVVHLAQFWVGTALKRGSVFGRRQHSSQEIPFHPDQEMDSFFGNKYVKIVAIPAPT